MSSYLLTMSAFFVILLIAHIALNGVWQLTRRASSRMIKSLSFLLKPSAPVEAPNTMKAYLRYGSSGPMATRRMKALPAPVLRLSAP